MAAKKLTDLMAQVQERVDAAIKRQDQDDTPVQMFLPGLEEWARAMPNHLARSSLFAPVARGRKKLHNETPLVTRSDCILTYTGEQLDEAQADVALQLLYDGRKAPLGQRITFHRRAFLLSIGRTSTGPNYDWLHRTMKAFGKATLIIEAKKPNGTTRYHIGSTKLFHILDFEYNEETEEYSYLLDPRWKMLFGNREFALVDWHKRLQIGRGHDMAKTLQRLIAASSDSPQHFRLTWLKDKMQYSGRMRDFRAAIEREIQELARLEIIAAGRIEDSTRGNEQLTVWRVPKDE